jgi:hypothetical protein
MAINFPANPILGQEFNDGTAIWVYDGFRWSRTNSLIESANDIDSTELTDGASLLYNAETETWEAKVDTSAIAYAIALG